MSLHLVKLCVGAESIADLAEWQQERLSEKRRRGEEPILKHTTRQMPKRRAEILDGGSLYWVIKGVLCCRQPILDLRARVDAEGIERCDICLGAEIVRVDPRPRGPFQGWRYFEAKDAPPDLAMLGEGEADMPDAMRHDLRLLGVL